MAVLMRLESLIRTSSRRPPPQLTADLHAPSAAALLRSARVLQQTMASQMTSASTQGTTGGERRLSASHMPL